MRFGGAGRVGCGGEKYVLETGLYSDTLHDVLCIAGVVAQLRARIHGKKSLARHQQRCRCGQRDQQPESHGHHQFDEGQACLG